LLCIDACPLARISQIRCTKDKSCSGKAETVIITDMNYYPVSKYHFDLSGTAFGRLAKPGLNDKLRHSGIIDIEFTRSVPVLSLSSRIYALFSSVLLPLDVEGTSYSHCSRSR
jgi:hypothetical protein